MDEQQRYILREKVRYGFDGYEAEEYIAPLLDALDSRDAELEQVTRERDFAAAAVKTNYDLWKAAEAREQALRETLEHGLLTLESARAWLNAWCEHGPIEFGGEADLGIEIDARIRHFINAITTTTPAEGQP